MSAVDFERRLEGGRGMEIWVMKLWVFFSQFFIKPLMYDWPPIIDRGGVGMGNVFILVIIQPL